MNKFNPFLNPAHQTFTVRKRIANKFAEIRARREKKQLEVNKILSKKRKN